MFCRKLSYTVPYYQGAGVGLCAGKAAKTTASASKAASVTAATASKPRSAGAWFAYLRHDWLLLVSFMSSLVAGEIFACSDVSALRNGKPIPVEGHSMLIARAYTLNRYTCCIVFGQRPLCSDIDRHRFCNLCVVFFVDSLHLCSCHIKCAPAQSQTSDDLWAACDHQHKAINKMSFRHVVSLNMSQQLFTRACKRHSQDCISAALQSECNFLHQSHTCAQS